MTPWQHLGTRMLFGWGSGTTHVFQQCLGGWVGFWWSQIRLADFQVPRFQVSTFQVPTFQVSKFQVPKCSTFQVSKFQGQSSKVKVPKFQDRRKPDVHRLVPKFQGPKFEVPKFRKYSISTQNLESRSPTVSQAASPSPHEIWMTPRPSPHKI